MEGNVMHASSITSVGHCSAGRIKAPFLFQASSNDHSTKEDQENPIGAYLSKK